MTSPLYPAYSCKLPCGRYVVVTNHAEANQGFFVEKHVFSGVYHARVHAYKNNLGRWKGTVYTEHDPPPGFKLKPGQEP